MKVNAANFFKSAAKEPEQFYIIHYSSQSLYDADSEGHSPLTTPLICQTGPKTSAKIGCSCSMREKPCISGRSLASGIMGIRS